MNRGGVIVTRPAGQAEHVAQLLAAQGYEAIRSPVLTIVPCDGPMPPVADIAAILITSANAFVGTALPQTLQALPCYCVGENTAQAARAAGFHRVIQGTSDGSALARQLVRDAASGAQVLHLCGRDVEMRATEIIVAAGLSVIPWVRYEAQLMSHLTEGAVAAIRSGKVLAVLAYSSRSAQNFLALLEKAHVLQAMKSVHVVAISRTVANLFNPVEWHRIVVAPQPSDEAMVQSLNKICAAHEGKPA